MSIKIAAWNIEGRLSPRTHGRRGSPQHILAGIRRLDADIIVLPEVYYEKIAPGVDEQLQQLGYQWQDALYGDIILATDSEDRSKGVYLRILSRLPLEDVRRLRFRDVRTLLTATVVDPSSGRRIRLLATHLDDRAEALRMKQVEAMEEFINTESMPTVMLGDFNAIWDSWVARWVRSRLVRWLAGHAPSEWLRSVAIRFTDMASGTALQFLADHAGMHDADVKRKATATPKLYGAEWLPSIRLAQLDHILLSDDLDADHVDVARDGGSDHRAIMTTIRVR